MRLKGWGGGSHRERVKWTETGRERGREGEGERDKEREK